MFSYKRSVLPAASIAVLVLISVEGCPIRPKAPEGPATSAVGASPPPRGSVRPSGHEGRPYDIDSRASLLTILAFRGGALAKAGHNHVIASHDLSGTFYVPEDVSRASFEVHVPVQQLSIDEPELRAREGADFPTDVPQSAKDGTRHNMLSEALLNGDQYPEILLVSQSLVPGSSGAAMQAQVQMTVRGQAHTINVPVTYTLAGGELVASGEMVLKQTDLGLTPFSAMLGALQVQDEMKIRFRMVAREAKTRGP